jgi:5-methylthioadenosine/S-adenosylhomocysteine deaminase
VFAEAALFRPFGERQSISVERGEVGKILIRSAACILTMDEKLGIIRQGDVLIDGNVIAAVGKNLKAEGAEVIDGTDRIVMPGLIDTHRHVYQAMLRGCGGFDDYQTYWKRVSQGYGSNFLPEDTYTSIRYGLAEALESGITTMHAWEQNMESPAHADAAVRALRDSGMRGRFSYGPASNPNSPHSIMNPGGTIDLDDVGRIRDEQFTVKKDGRHYTPGGLLHLGIACRAAKATKPEIWQSEFAFGRREGIPITVHVAGGGISLYREYQALGPDVLAVHAHHASDDELHYLARSKTPVSVSITSLLKVGIGRSPIVAMMRAGIHVCLSVDSSIAADTGDLFALMRTSILVERGLYEDPTVYQPDQVLQQATINGAIAMGLGEVTGSLTPGKRADIIVLRTDDLNMGPLIEPQTQVVFSAQPRNVETVLVDGMYRKRNGQLVGIDVPDLLHQVKQAVDNLGKRMGEPIH